MALFPLGVTYISYVVVILGEGSVKCHFHVIPNCAYYRAYVVGLVWLSKPNQLNLPMAGWETEINPPGN